MTHAADIRLNKFISETGICSRREADRLIEEGSVQVNGRPAEMGMRVTSADHILVRGKPLKVKPKAVYIAYNKPVGITCTTDPAIAGNIVDAVRSPGRIFPIGRLDKPSEGLILLTNDGDIVNKILRAGNAHEKEYRVRVDRPIDAEFLQRMATGVPVLDTVTRPCTVRQVSPDSFVIILTQGLNRQIRRMTEYLGYEVIRLRRVRVMNIELGGLKPGQWRELNQEELALVDEMIASSSKTEEASLPRTSSRNPSHNSHNPSQKAARKRTPAPSHQPKLKTDSKPSGKSSRSGKTTAAARPKSGARGKAKSGSARPGRTSASNRTRPPTQGRPGRG